MRATEGSFTNTRNQKLKTWLYEPSSGVDLKGVVVRHHGLGDYAEKYKEEAEILSSECRFAIKRFADLVDDFEQMLTEVVEPWRSSQAKPPPMFLSGASMGGLVVMHVLGRGKIPQPAGAVLSCVAAGVERTLVMRMQEPFAGLLNKVMPNAKLVPALAPETLCVSAEAAQMMRDDPMNIKDAVRVCTACSMLEGMKVLPQQLPNITCPVLMLHGKQDVTCTPETARAALEHMPSRDRTWVLLTKAKHNLELDVCKEEFQASMLEWLAAHCAPAAPPVSSGTSESTDVPPVPPVREIVI